MSHLLSSLCFSQTISTLSLQPPMPSSSSARIVLSVLGWSERTRDQKHGKQAYSWKPHVKNCHRRCKTRVPPSSVLFSSLNRSMDIPVIPEDIIRLIFDNVKDDIATLQACALVSHSFLEPALSLLYSTIEINFASQVGVADIRKLCEIVDARPGIRRMIRKLHLRDIPEKGKDEQPQLKSSRAIDHHLLLELMNGRWSKPLRSAFAPLAQILSDLPCLRHFSFIASSVKNLNWTTIPEDLRTGLNSIFRQSPLLSLRLEGLQNLPVSVFDQLDQLEKLQVFQCSITPTTPNHAPEKLRLRSLHVKVPRSESMRLILAQASTEQLLEAELAIDDWDMVHELNNFVAESPMLESLSLDMLGMRNSSATMIGGQAPETAPPSIPIDLSLLLSLKTIAFHLTPQNLPWSLDTLLHTPSKSRLSSVSLTIRPLSISQIASNPTLWEGWDDRLSSGNQFPDLKSLKIVLDPALRGEAMKRIGIDYKDVVGEIKEHQLKELGKRGVLDISGP